MIRGIADRVYSPTRGVAQEMGDLMILTGKTVRSAVRPPFNYGAEFSQQFMFVLKLCWFPLFISSLAFNYGAPGLQAANFLNLFGSLDRLGGFFVLAGIRENAPFITAVVVAGVAGTAITADLGARKIREELDALQVLGIDTVKSLVVPRFLALMITTGLFDIYALIVSIAGGVIASLVNLDGLSHLWTSDYGLMLLRKLVFVALLLVAGAWNWRLMKPRLGADDRVRAFQRSARPELTVGAIVLVFTAFLVALALPD